MSIVIGAVSGGVSLAARAFPIVSAVKQRREIDKARRANRAASAIEQRKARIANARERRKAAIRARQAGQTALAFQAATGVQSTGFSGTLAAIGNQAASNISFQRKMGNLSEQQIGLMNSASQAEGRANTIGARGQAVQALGLPSIGDFASLGVRALSGTSFFSGPSNAQIPQVSNATRNTSIFTADTSNAGQRFS